MIELRRVEGEAVRTISSTYSRRKGVCSGVRRMKREVSDLEPWKPMETMKVANRVNQARRACLSPYKDFFCGDKQMKDQRDFLNLRVDDSILSRISDHGERHFSLLTDGWANEKIP
jgi:hypothetical protein